MSTASMIGTPAEMSVPSAREPRRDVLAGELCRTGATRAGSCERRLARFGLAGELDEQPDEQRANTMNTQPGIAWPTLLPAIQLESPMR